MVPPSRYARVIGWQYSSKLRSDSGVTLPQYTGRISYEATVEIPSEKCALKLDSSELYTRLYINEEPLGGQWSIYCFAVPSKYLGKEVKIKIVQYTTI